MSTPHVIGLDLSLTGSGVASSAVWAQTIGAKGVTAMPIGQRIGAIDALADKILLAVGTPDLVVVESPAFSRSGGGALERAALWWLVVRAITRRDIPLAVVHNNTRMRYATGLGRAGKGAIVDAVARRYPQYQTGGDDNLADAIVLAAMGADRLGHPLAALPKAHRAALDAVTWPAQHPTNGEP